MKPITCILLSMMVLECFAQPKNFNTQRNWSISKKELSFGVGATQFVGDLGGVNKLSSNHGIADFTFPSTSWSSQLGYRYRFHPYYATKSRIQVGQLRGNDNLKVDDYQHSRNLHFRAFYVEFSQRFEIILFAKEKATSRIPLLSSWPHYYQFYLYAGAGLLYYNPQAKYNGTWIDLQPLKTEGQGLPGGATSYKRLTASIPLGIGYRFNISRFFRLGVELEYTVTFSDYLDDVGGNYYDPTVLEAQFGSASAELSNPSTQHPEWFQVGMNRGNQKARDSYLSFSVLIIKNITYRNSRSRKGDEPENQKTKDLIEF